MKTFEKHFSSLKNWSTRGCINGTCFREWRIKMSDLRVESLCLGSDAIGINGRHSLAKSLFTEHVINISTMGSCACAKREHVRIRIIWCLWYMMKLRSWLRRKHQSGVQNWRCCSFAFAGCRRRDLLRAPAFSTSSSISFTWPLYHKRLNYSLRKGSKHYLKR